MAATVGSGAGGSWEQSSRASCCRVHGKRLAIAARTSAPAGGPTVTAGSLGSPTTNESTCSNSCSVNSPAISSSTMIRLGAIHDWSVFWNLLLAVHTTVASRSVSGRTMNGSMPPSSRTVVFSARPATAATDVPAPVEPVSVTTATRSFRFRKVRVSAEGELDLIGSSELERVLRLELLADVTCCSTSRWIDFIDLSGLHAIVKSVRTAKDIGRTLSLNPDLPAHARRLMEIVVLLPFIPIRSRRTGTQLRGRRRV